MFSKRRPNRNGEQRRRQFRRRQYGQGRLLPSLRPLQCKLNVRTVMP